MMANSADIEDVIDSLEDALRAAEMIRDGGIEEGSGKAAALKAIDEIRRGDHAEAITTLEREFLPKWQSTEGCRAAYEAVAVARVIERAIA